MVAEVQKVAQQLQVELDATVSSTFSCRTEMVR